MAQLIDIYGLSLDPDMIESVRLENRSAIAYPIFREDVSGAPRWKWSKPKLGFISYAVFGILLQEGEAPAERSVYEMNTRQPGIIESTVGMLVNPIQGVLKLAGDAINHVSNAVKSYRIITRDRSVKSVMLSQIPAKAELRSGQVIDIWQKDADGYSFINATPEPLTDYPVKALIIKTRDNRHYMLFSGFDVPEAEISPCYRTLLKAHNDAEAARAANAARPEIALPPIFQNIRLRSPFVIGTDENEAQNDRQPNAQGDDRRS